MRTLHINLSSCLPNRSGVSTSQRSAVPRNNRQPLRLCPSRYPRTMGQDMVWRSRSYADAYNTG